MYMLGDELHDKAWSREVRKTFDDDLKAWKHFEFYSGPSAETYDISNSDNDLEEEKNGTDEEERPENSTKNASVQTPIHHNTHEVKI